MVYWDTILSSNYDMVKLSLHGSIARDPLTVLMAEFWIQIRSEHPDPRQRILDPRRLAINIIMFTEKVIE